MAGPKGPGLDQRRGRNAASMPLDLFVPSMHIYAMLMLIIVECVLKCVCVCVCWLRIVCVFALVFDC